MKHNKKVIKMKSLALRRYSFLSLILLICIKSELRLKSIFNQEDNRNELSTEYELY